jgi:Ca2+:H+ antiporter
LSVYGAYLVFQLWSHTHFYEDSKTTSNKLSKTIRDRRAEQRPGTSDSQMSPLRKSSYINLPYATASDVTLGYPDLDCTNPKHYQHFNPAGWSATSLVDDPKPGDNKAGVRQNTLREATDELLPERMVPLQPELSWTMTLFLLTSVTIVSLSKILIFFS